MENIQLKHEYGYVRDEEIYLKGFLDYPDRRIGQVKQSPEASLKYFEDRFALAKKKVEDLAFKVEDSQNKGSYLMKLIHMRKYLANFDGLGDYVALFNRLDELEAQLRAMIAVNRVKNYEIKSALLADAEACLDDPNLNEATDRIKEIKLKWIKTGAVLEDHKDYIEKRFDEVYAEFFEHKKNVLKNRARQIKGNLYNYKRILYRAEEIKYSDDFDNAFAEFRDMQQEWKSGGKIPHKKATQLWDKFRQVNDTFFTRYKQFKLYKEQYPEASALEIRQKLSNAMCIEMESLVDLHHQNLHNVERGKELLMDWKNLTTTFRNVDEDEGERFRLASDKIFEISYLFRVVKRKYPDVEHKPQEDQLRIKVSFMRELIRKDEAEIQLAETNLHRLDSNKRNPEYKKAESNLNTQKRKLGVKRIILRDLEDLLHNIKGQVRPTTYNRRY
ncbi:MAG: DUF349 domain-containing protein [Bacteroidetes bacterium]|nr:MAG: DUF349 domain-containing protein [Bacteroidota bacterium]